MKSILLVAVLAFALGLECFGQREKGKLEPILKRGKHTDAEMIAFMSENDEKSVQFRDYYVSGIKDLLKDTLNFTEKSIKWSYKFIQHKKVTLKAFEWMNSGWDKDNLKIQTFTLKKDWTGWVAEFKLGSYSKIMYKDSCANVLLLLIPSEFSDYNPEPAGAPDPVKPKTPTAVTTTGTGEIKITVNVNCCGGGGQTRPANTIAYGVTNYPTYSDDGYYVGGRVIGYGGGYGYSSYSYPNNYYRSSGYDNYSQRGGVRYRADRQTGGRVTNGGHTDGNTTYPGGGGRTTNGGSDGGGRVTNGGH